MCEQHFEVFKTISYIKQLFEVFKTITYIELSIQLDEK